MASIERMRRQVESLAASTGADLSDNVARRILCGVQLDPRDYGAPVGLQALAGLRVTLDQVLAMGNAIPNLLTQEDVANTRHALATWPDEWTADAIAEANRIAHIVYRACGYGDVVDSIISADSKAPPVREVK